MTVRKKIFLLGVQKSPQQHLPGRLAFLTFAGWELAGVCGACLNSLGIDLKLNLLP
jgi:hypothetical protein